MFKLATSALAVSLLALPALAAPTEQYERSVAENDLYGRDLTNMDDIIVTREELDEIFGREFIDSIEERSPFGLGGAFRIAKGFVGHHSHHHMPSMDSNNNNNGNGNNDRRDLDEEFEAREPFGLGGAFRIAKGFVGHHSHHHMPSMDSNNNNGNGNNDRREFDEEEFEAREPFGLGGAFRIAKGFVGHHSHHHMPSMDSNNNNNGNGNNDRREFDEEFEAREPFGLGGAFRIAKGFVGHHSHHHMPSMDSNNNNGNGNNDRREFEEELELRDFDEDLEARELIDIDEEVFEREFDDEEFLAREYYDDLD